MNTSDRQRVQQENIRSLRSTKKNKETRQWTTKRSQGNTVKNNIKNTHRHESIKHDSDNEHGRTKLLLGVKNSITSTKRGWKQDN